MQNKKLKKLKINIKDIDLLENSLYNINKIEDNLENFPKSKRTSAIQNKILCQ